MKPRRIREKWWPESVGYAAIPDHSAGRPGVGPLGPPAPLAAAAGPIGDANDPGEDERQRAAAAAFDNACITR